MTSMGLGASAAVALVVLAAEGGAQEAPVVPAGEPAKAPPAEAAPAGPASGATPPPLKIDIGQVVAAIVARMLAAPRFEDEIEVRDRYQEALDAYLRSAELACGATEAGPPSADETYRYRETRRPPTADLLAGAKWLHRRLKGQGARAAPRYFLYAVHLEKAPARRVYVVRDGPIAENDRSAVAGTSWELVGRYVERSAAADAVGRLQRGLADGESGSERRPAVVWAAAGCRP